MDGRLQREAWDLGRMTTFNMVFDASQYYWDGVSEENGFWTI